MRLMERVERRPQRHNGRTPALVAPRSSDEHLHEQVQRALQQTLHTRNHQVRASIRHGQVVLAGVVHSFYAKQLAQTAVMNVPGVRLLKNELEVA